VHPIATPVEAEYVEKRRDRVDRTIIKKLFSSLLEEGWAMVGEPGSGGIADLEMGLHRREDGRYAIELRYRAADSDSETRLLRESSEPVRIDIDGLRQQRLDGVAYGRLLSESLFASAAVRQAFAQARTQAAAQFVPLRLRLLIGPSAPELQALRWEALYDPENDRPLLSEQLLFTRYATSFDWRPTKLRPKDALRPLVVIANPTDLADYDLTAIDTALEQQIALEGLATLPTTVLATQGQATLMNIITRLRDGADLLVLIAHGALVEGEPYLWLENEQGTTARVSGRELAQRIAALPQLPRLVVLVSCQSAGDESAATARAALGPLLAEAGVPAVLCMQGNIQIATARRFMSAFYRELQRDGQIDRATAVARTAIADPEQAWIPALYSRLRSGRFWYVPGFGGEAFRKWPSLLSTIHDGKCTPIVGTGVLEGLIGTPREIARRWAEDFGFPLEPHARDDLPQVAQFLSVDQDPGFALSELKRSLERELIARFGNQLSEDQQRQPLNELLTTVWQKRATIVPHDPHVVLARLPFPIYLSTNSDDLLAQALQAAGRTPEVVICPWNRYGETSQSEYLGSPQVDTPLVYQLYGRLTEPESLVLTEDDYFRYLIGVTGNTSLIPDVVLRALADTALLFVGFRLDEWDFRVLYQSVINQPGRRRRRRYSHVAVQIDPEGTPDIDPQRVKAYFERYFGEADIAVYWGSAEDFLRELAERYAAAKW
jgi:hypothetical protein